MRLVTLADDYRARSFAAPPIDAALSPALQVLLSAGNRAERPLVALAAGGARNVARDNPLRRWPLANYAALAELLAARGFAIALAGAQTDSWTRAAFAALPASI